MQPINHLGQAGAEQAFLCLGAQRVEPREVRPQLMVGLQWVVIRLIE
ncbi:hypothetical protein ACFW0H_29170 [Pseudomonas sp. CR3202]